MPLDRTIASIALGLAHGFPHRDGSVSREKVGEQTAATTTLS